MRNRNILITVVAVILLVPIVSVFAVSVAGIVGLQVFNVSSNAAPAGQTMNVAFIDASPIYATGSNTGSTGVTIVPMPTEAEDETKLVISFATGIYSSEHDLFALTKTGQKLKIKAGSVSMGVGTHKVITYLCTVPTSSDQIARIVLEPKAED